MTFIERKEEALKKKIIPETKCADFEAFWQKAIADMRQVPLSFTKEKIDTPYDKTFTTYKIFYNTHDNTKVAAYFSCPNNAQGPLPCVAHFHGGSLQKKNTARYPCHRCLLLGDRRTLTGRRNGR